MKKNTKNIKKNKCQTAQQKCQNRGKPSDLKSTELEIPQIWTNQPQCIQLLKFLTVEGRHLSLHLAGKNSQAAENIQKYNDIQNTKKFYQNAQDITEKLFDIKYDSMRCIVFFFRNPNEKQSTNNFQQNIQKEIHLFILDRVYRLLSEKFINDLILILGNENEIDKVIDQLFQVQEQPSHYSQIIQNLFIKQKIQQMKEEKKQQFSIKEVEQEFKDFLVNENTRYQVRIFIDEILNIFQTSHGHIEYDYI